MALSFITQPSDEPLRLWDSYNDVVYVVESSLVAAEFARFDVEVNGQTVMALERPLDVTSKRTFVNVKEILRDYLTYTFQTGNTLAKNTNNVASLRVVCTELDVNGYSIGVTGLSDYSYILNSAQTFREVFTSNLENIDVSENVTPSFLTSLTSRTIYSTDKDWLSFYYGSGTYEPVEVVFKKYNIAGGLIATNNVTIGALDANNTYTFGSGGANVLELFGGSYLTGVSYYTVQIDTTNALFTYYIKTKCNDNENIRIAFLNKYGVYDAFTFDLKSEDTSEIERSTFQKTKGSFDGSTYSFGDGKETVSTFVTTVTNNLKCNSDWLTDEVSEWLKQLFTSPSVYVYRGGYWEACTVQDKTYVNKKVVNDWLFNYTIRLEYSDKSMRQR